MNCNVPNSLGSSRGLVVKAKKRLMTEKSWVQTPTEEAPTEEAVSGTSHSDQKPGAKN